MLTSIIRTLVPLLVGVLGPLATNWLGWTDATTSGVLTAVVAGLYYLAVRGLEQVRPGIGVLLGVPIQPTYDRDGRHELGRDPEFGGARLRVVLLLGALVAVVLALVAGAGVASGHPRPTAARPLVVPHVISALDCDGVLWVQYGARQVSGRTVTDVLDDGRTGGLELLDISGRSQPHGVWLSTVAGRGGEGVLRVPDWHQQHPGAHFRFARVVREDRGRVESGPVLITVGCPG